MLLCEGAPLLTLSASPVLASDYVYDISTSSAIGQYIGADTSSPLRPMRIDEWRCRRLVAGGRGTS
jgi:hypothetical protein